MKKIGNTSFQEEAIKKMSLKDFKGLYRNVLVGQDLDKIYSEITGKKSSIEE